MFTVKMSDAGHVVDFRLESREREEKKEEEKEETVCLCAGRVPSCHMSFRYSSAGKINR